MGETTCGGVEMNGNEMAAAIEAVRAHTGCFACKHHLPMRFGDDLNAMWCDHFKHEVPGVMTGSNAGLDCEQWWPDLDNVDEWIHDLNEREEVADVLEKAAHSIRQEAKEEREG
jgi:hypothetical protein